MDELQTFLAGGRVDAHRERDEKPSNLAADLRTIREIAEKLEKQWRNACADSDA